MNGTNEKMEDDKNEDVEEIAMMPKAGWKHKEDQDLKEGKKSCGLGGCKPKPLQIFSGIWTFTLIYGLSSLIVNTMRTYLNTQLFMLERQFEMSSSTTGVLVSCTDIGFLVFVLFTSYFARSFPAPRVLAISSALFGVAALLCVLPHAVTKGDLYSPPTVTENNSYSLLKLKLKAPSCMVGNLPPEFLGSLMSKMAGPGGQNPFANMIPSMGGGGVQNGGGATDDSPKSPFRTTDKTPYIGTGNSDKDNTSSELSNAAFNKPESPQTTISPDKLNNQNNNVPEKKEVTQTPLTISSANPVQSTPPSSDNMEVLIMPNFTKLSTHPRFEELVQLAMGLGIDIKAIAVKPQEDQVTFMKNLPPNVQRLLPSLKLLLGPDSDSYFYPVTVPKSRKRRDARKDISRDMMHSGMLSMIMKNLPPIPEGVIGEMSSKLCPFNTTPFMKSSNSVSVLVALLAVGMLIQGMARAPRLAFATIYVDDNSQESRTALHLGVIIGLGTLGGALAQALGGLASLTYVTLEDTGHLTVFNPRWLGAWWLGFLICGLLSLVLAIPLLMFPNLMTPKHNKERKELETRKSKVAKGSKGMFQSLMRLIGNPVFVLLTFANAISVMAVVGLLTFLPKYVETQFSVSPFTTGMILSVVYFLTASLGMIVGGFITTKANLSPLNCVKMVSVIALVLVVIQAVAIGVGCEQPALDKGDKVIGNTSTTLCNSTCVCVEQMYSPVCGSDGLSYYSPCHAGCGEGYDGKYHDCKCIDDNTKTATPNLCEQPCNFLYVFCGLVVLGGFLMHLKAIPAFIATYRSVASRDAPLAIGVNSFISTLVGLIPSPIIFGSIIDGTCSLHRHPCGFLGLCAIYDIETFRHHFHGLSAALRGVAALLYIGAMVLGLRSTSVFRRRVHEKERRK